MMVRSKVCHSWYYCRGHSISISISKTNVARCQLSEEIWQGWERCHREARRCSCCQWDVTCYPELAPSEFCSSRQQKASRLSDCLDPGGGDDDWLASRVAWGQIFLSGLSAWPMIRSSGYCILPLPLLEHCTNYFHFHYSYSAQTTTSCTGVTNDQEQERSVCESLRQTSQQ